MAQAAVSSQLDMIRGLLTTPSLYAWLIPRNKTPTELDALAAQGGFPTLLQLAPAALYCLAFGLARLVLTRLVFKPLAIYSMKLRINASSQPIPVVDAYVRENQYEKTAKKTKKRVAKDVDTLVQELVKSGVANKAELGEKASPASLRLYLIGRRRSQVVEKKVVKFVEALWRGIFYFVFVVIGATFLFYPEPQEWVMDTRKHWLGWPQPVSNTVVVYYQLALGCYLHQLMWTEVSRSDALEMILHHITTILLLGMSFLTQFTRVGASILLVHDVADVFLESAKCFNYAAQNNAGCKRWASPLCDVLFGCFAVSFFVTRLIIYPRYLVWSLVVESPPLLGGSWPGHWGFSGLLLTLLALHVFWFMLICKMIYRMFTTGIEKDERSDDEEETEEDDEPEGRTKAKAKGKQS